MSNYSIECSYDNVLQSDIEGLLQINLPIENLDGKTVLITGATGLIGSQLAMSIAYFIRKRNLDIKLILVVRNIEKAKVKLGNIIDYDYVTLIKNDILTPLSYNGEVDYIIHTASATSSRFFVTNPVETINIAINGTKNILEFAKNKKIKCMVYLSSLEVYGRPSREKKSITELDFGYFDPLQVRSSYSEGKRLAECLCYSYASEYNVPIKIARLSQTFGPGVEYNDSRVFAEFARCAIEKKDIILHTRGNTVRTYCYTKDAVAAIFTILFKGVIGEAYNVSNEQTAISIKDMALLVSNLFKESNIQVRFDSPKNLDHYGYNPEMVIVLNCKKLRKLGWFPSTNIKDMFLRLVKSMKICHK